MPLTIDTLGQSLPTEVGLAINELSTLFKEDCVVSVLDDQTTDTWQLKVRSGRYTRVLNLDVRHQTARDIQLALQKVQASLGDHCHSCFRSGYLLK
jgi:TFIIF-interacting CTD phosphatase-like protein